MTISSQCSMTSSFVMVGISARLVSLRASRSTAERRLRCQGDSSRAVFTSRRSSARRWSAIRSADHSMRASISGIIAAASAMWRRRSSS